MNGATPNVIKYDESLSQKNLKSNNHKTKKKNNQKTLK